MASRAASPGTGVREARSPTARARSSQRRLRTLGGLSVLFTWWIALPSGPTATGAPTGVEILRPIGALPARLSTTFLDPTAYVETPAGVSIVLDRRAAGVFEVDAARTSVRRLVPSGSDGGGLQMPDALALGPDDVFAVADTVSGAERIQYFSGRGARLGGFYLPDRSQARIAIDGVAMNGLGSLQFGARSFFVSLPARGRLVSELDVDGQTVRQFGLPRPTGHETDPDLEALFNIGLPLIDPTGGFYFVFQTDRPIFRKYTAAGDLMLERHIEGPELDAAIAALPTEWRPRAPGEGRLPIAKPLVRTAAVDPSGRLWVALTVPFTYVYDARGDRVRTVQFNATGPLAPASLFFAAHDRLLVTPGCYEFSAK
jgi:hypothetical protein